MGNNQTEPASWAGCSTPIRLSPINPFSFLLHLYSASFHSSQYQFITTVTQNITNHVFVLSLTVIGLIAERSEGKYQVSRCFLPPIVFSIGICGFLWVAHKSQYKSNHRRRWFVNRAPIVVSIGNQNQPIQKAKCCFLSWFLNAAAALAKRLLCYFWHLPDNSSRVFTHSLQMSSSTQKQ